MAKYCMCKDKKQVDKFILGCDSGLDSCPGRQWYHLSCLGLQLTEEEAAAMEHLVCPAC